MSTIQWAQGVDKKRIPWAQGASSGAALEAPIIAYITGSWNVTEGIHSRPVTNTGGASTDFVLLSGTLPIGASLNATTGLIDGTWFESSGTFTVRATNAGGTGDTTQGWNVAR